MTSWRRPSLVDEQLGELVETKGALVAAREIEERRELLQQLVVIRCVAASPHAQASSSPRPDLQVRAEYEYGDRTNVARFGEPAQ